MDFQEVIRRRRMVRRYDAERPVPPEMRDRLLANAQRAPSAGFSQGWAFLVLEDGADRDRFWSTTRDDGLTDSWLDGMQTAPLLVVALSHKDAYLDRYAEADKGWRDRDESQYGTGMAALLMLLTAVDLELAACFFGIAPHRIAPLRAEFGVPDAYTPVGVVSVGYPAPDRRSPSLARGRRDPEEVVHHGRW
jgi:nitroreductase